MRFEELNITPKAMRYLADARSTDIKSAGGFPDVLRVIENAAAMGQYSLKYYVSRNVQDCVCAILDDLCFDYNVKSQGNSVIIEIDWSNNEV